LVCTSAQRRGLVHHGLLHPPSTDLADILTPLIAERLTRGEPVLAALPPTTMAQLHDRLPSLAGLHTADPGRLCRHPGRVLGHYLGWVADTCPDGPATIVAAPALGNDPHRAALWMHIDALATQALAKCNLTLVCAYPNDPATAAAIRHAHPSLLNGAATPSPDHLPADQFLAHHPLPPPTELGQPDATHIIDHPAQLTELRKVTASHAARAGLPTSRRDDFVLAVTEVATNALQHGDLPAAVCLWATSTSVICQISDNGHFTQPLAGLLPPPTNQGHASGLWMAHQLCDELYRWPQPTTIRLQIDRPQAPSRSPTDSRL
jgi:anti-sigma regulatory factor (Ser/Thr protein kinase)